MYDALTQALPNAIGRSYRELPFESGGIVPTEANLEAGVEFVTEDILTEQGEALILADTMDIPVVHVGMTKDRYPVYMVAAGFYFTFKSTRSLRRAGQYDRIADRQLANVRRAIAERLNRFAAVGDIRLNQRGFLNNNLVPVRANSIDLTDGGLTANQLREFVIEGLWYTYRDRTGHTKWPAKLLISSNLYERLTLLLMPDSAMSVLDSVLETINAGGASGGGMSLEIQYAPECDAQFLEANGVFAPGTGKDRLVFHPGDYETAHREVELFDLIPEDWLGSETGKKKFAGFQCSTPTIWTQPTNGLYMDVVSA